MTRFPCKRTWEIEALEDGRLLEKDRASIARHLEACQDCQEAQGKLRSLAEMLKALPPEERTDMEHRRARAALLGRANALAVGGERSQSRWLVLLAAPVAVAVFVIVTLLRREPAPNDPTARSGAPSAPAIASASAPIFEVDAVGRADYASERANGVSQVTLRAGTAAFHVEHVKPGARFLVKVPDGEVEVRGTRFVVDVVDGHTRSVVVTEGVVAVRVEGFDGVLRAGERWPATSSALPAPGSAQPTPGAEPPTSAQPTAGATSASPPPAASQPAAVATAPAASVVRSGPGPRFAEAMAAFNSGDYAAADRLFAAFVREFPSDSRAEDAMFLVADTRTRRGDTEGARAAARAYLERFPQGLRAPAVRRIASERGAGAAKPD